MRSTQRVHHHCGRVRGLCGGSALVARTNRGVSHRKTSGSDPPKSPPTAEIQCAAEAPAFLVLPFATRQQFEHNCWWKTTKKCCLQKNLFEFEYLNLNFFVK